jgi:hypothetical protein
MTLHPRPCPAATPSAFAALLQAVRNAWGAPVADTHPEATDTLRALVATGLPPWDAAVTLVDNGFPKAAFPMLARVPDAVIRPIGDLLEFVEAIREAAKFAPKDARGLNAFMNAWLQGRHLPGDLSLMRVEPLRELPRGLTVGGDLILTGSCRLATLPDGLRVGGTLRMVGCSALTRLPQGLVVGKNLIFQPHACGPRLRWDGLIPEDAEIGFSIYSPAQPSGITLERWRQFYPQGERT